MNTIYLLIQIGFAVLTVIFFGLLLKVLKSALAGTSYGVGQKQKIYNRSLVAMIAWTIFISILSLTGVLSDFSVFPPRVFFVLIIPLITVIVVLNLKGTTEMLRHTPPHHLIRLQVFRVFVEILLWALFTQNLLPVQMTFEGRNFDILSGLSAPFIYYFGFEKKMISRTIILIWNFICLGLLLNIVINAILSAPTPFQKFAFDQPNIGILYFPFVWLPCCIVPLVLLSHLAVIRQLFRQVKY
jgi:hypothetical protein